MIYSVSFTGRMTSCRPTNSVKALKALQNEFTTWIITSATDRSSWCSVGGRRRRYRPEHQRWAPAVHCGRTFSASLCWPHRSDHCGTPGRVAGSAASHRGSKQTQILSWRRAVVVSGVRCMNEVNSRRARLVLGRVTIFGRAYHLGM